MLEFWTFIRQQLQDGFPVFVAIVAHHSRHSPGTTGAQLAVSKNGDKRGTIGGGIMEAEVLELAEKALSTADYPPRFERLYHRRKAPEDSAKTSGLICAGNQTNVYLLATPEKDLSDVEEICNRLQNDKAGLVEITRSGLTLTDYTPEEIEPPFQFSERAADRWRFSMQLLNYRRIAIIGGGHCGLALSRVMQQLGYTVTIFDTRPDLFTFTGNEFATHRIAVEDYAEAGPKISYPHWTHVAVMTANLPSDVRGLLGVANLPFPYIGVMGAPAKLTRINSDLRELGVDDEAMKRFHAPIGLAMTSNTPEEIAISIAAEILKKREELFSFTKPPSP